MSRLLIRNGTIVNENERYWGYILIENERIAEIGPGDYPFGPFNGKVIDADGLFVLPGVIDDQVHFREPGLTHKADIGSESAAEGMENSKRSACALLGKRTVAAMASSKTNCLVIVFMLGIVYIGYIT